MSNQEPSAVLGTVSGLNQSAELILSNLHDVAQEHYRSGRYDESVAYLDVILKDSPNYLPACSLIIKVLLAQNKYGDALPYAERCLQLEPQTTEFWDIYLDIIKRFGDEQVLMEAQNLRATVLRNETGDRLIDSSDRLVAPESKGVQEITLANNRTRSVSKESERKAFARLLSLYEKQKWLELENYAKQCIKRDVCVGFAWRFLGVLYLEKGALDLAEDAMKRSLSELPDDATSNFNFGLLCGAQGILDQAEAQYRRAIVLDPNFTAAYNNLGNILRSKGQLEEAETCFRKLISLSPDLAIAHFNLANVLIQKGSFLLALKVCLQATEKFPMSADLFNALGSIYFLLGRHEEAIAPLKRAIELNASYGDAYNNLGCVFFDQKDYVNARYYLLKVLEISSGVGSTYRCLGQIARELDRDYAKAIALTRKALELDPDDTVAHNSLLYMLSEFEDVTPEELFLEHKRYGARAEIRWQEKRSPHINSKDRDRLLKIGFVSGDFYKHAVASFFEPILASLAKMESIQLYAYYSNSIEDDITRRMKSYAKGWCQIEDLDDDEVCSVIRRDQIDILFDLSGHTSNNRLQLFARKPAPIAVSWIGYPGTTGLSTVDYFVADRFYIPYGEFDHLFTEKLVYIPCASTFQMEEGAPPVGPLPAISNGRLTFGSFNRISKITEGTIIAWSRLMASVPNSRILIGGMHSDRDLSTFLDLFDNNGVAKDRIDFFGRTNMLEYLALHNRVDICLDTFPYNGGTTIHHALSMGVPTLSIYGKKIPSRSSAAILGQVGLNSFLANDVDDFVARGVYWSQNLEALAEIRSQLRQICSDSIKSKPDLLASYLNRALRKMWEKWCDGEAASTFSVEEE